MDLMSIFKTLAAVIFILLGVLVLIKGIRAIRVKDTGASIIEIITGFGFAIIGMLIWLGYIS